MGGRSWGDNGVGEGARTDRVNPLFCANLSCSFLLGTIKQLEVFHTAPEPWFIAEVLVLNETTGVTGLFQANR